MSYETVKHFGHYSVYAQGPREKAIVDVSKLAELLPHGSGIDASWYIDVYKNGNIHVQSSFHLMNETGMYDGWTDFSFRVFRAKETKLHPLKGPSEGRAQVLHRKGDILLSPVSVKSRKASAWSLADYLSELIDYDLRELIPPRTYETIDLPEDHDG